MTQTGAQAAAVACEPEVATTPALVHRNIAKKETAKPATKKKPRFAAVTIGGTIEVSDGYTQRWAEIEEEDRRGFVHRRQVRLTDEDGLPVNRRVDTGRRLADGRVKIKFPAAQKLPSQISVVKGGLFLGAPKGTKSRQRPAEKATEFNTVEKIRAFIAALPRKMTAEELDAVLNPPVEPIPEQWFRIELTHEQLEAGAWENFPDGWCARLVEPQPPLPAEDRAEAKMVEEWVYVQFPFHYRVRYEDEAGRQKTVYRTDSAGPKEPSEDGSRLGYNAVERGMWVPRWLLVPVSLKEAAEIFEEIKLLF